MHSLFSIYMGQYAHGYTTYIHEHNINHVLPGQGKTNIIQSTMYPEENRIHI